MANSPLRVTGKRETIALMSEEWNWIEDLPEWDLPADLNAHDVPPPYNLAIMILSCKLLGNEVRALVGRYVTEYSYLNVWLASGGQQHLDGKAFLTLVSEIEQGTRRVYEAWKDLESSLNRSEEGTAEESLARISASSKSLETVLTGAVDFINRTRGAS